MTKLMNDDFELDPPESSRQAVLGPAVQLARANPGRWVHMTTHKTKGSAASYTSKLRSANSVYVRSGIEARRDGCDIYLRYTPADDEFSKAVIPADAPGVDDDSLASPPPLDPPADLS